MNSKCRPAPCSRRPRSPGAIWHRNMSGRSARSRPCCRRAALSGRRDRRARTSPDRLAGFLHRRSPAPDDRAGAGQQPRPADRGGQRASGAGAISHPARRSGPLHHAVGSVPTPTTSRVRPARWAAPPAAAPVAAPEREPVPARAASVRGGLVRLESRILFGQCGLLGIRARPVRPGAEPQPRRAGTVFRHRGGAALHAHQPDRRDRDRVADLCVGSGSARASRRSR